MKVLHIANFSYNRSGDSFYNSDRKISAGFVRNGHYVYEFSLRDMARLGTVFRTKKLGASWANAEVLRLCAQMEPDLVLLGHAQLLMAETLREIRKRHPGTRIALWYVDPLFHEDKTAYLRDFASYLEAIFATTGGEYLDKLALPTVTRAYFPNPVERSVDALENFRRRDFAHELIFCGTVGDDVQRRHFMEEVKAGLSDLPVRFQGLFGEPTINGMDYIRALAGSRMGLNHSRRNDVSLYSSDRVAQLSGNGLLTLSPRIPDFELLYKEDELGYFDTAEELVTLVRNFHANPEQAAQRAEAGWRRAHSTCAVERVARFMEEVTFGLAPSEAYEWQGHVFPAQRTAV